MKKIIRLTESDLARIVRRVISEAETAATGGPAAYGDYIVGETEKNLVWGSKGSTVEAFTHSKWGPNSPGNKVVVNGDRFSYDQNTGQYKKIGPETITLYQKCGAQANFLVENPLHVVSGGADPGKYTKFNGPIQNKLIQSCKAQGYKGQIQGAVNRPPNA
jgi:hypothetical protein